ncbi:Tungstate ABC transporter, ATP-binding protein WtpC [Methanosarcina sp. MTP4]|uniref:ATP-binding cassette domain-containing protein n=1 Tax=Methanosarcina sp. MTP4 TaxID=1434100 RepID=UPI0006154C6F|nr:ATP-binding cassette domain-containing protein [Methanosarcina sp. MTP4]AKB26459.1 Tungstate ABC transporter, ATP-binding protein WtpC [Methanosarcina sp. MTP4]
MSFLEVRDLHLDLGGFELTGMGLNAEKGDYVALTGPSGSGKSLLLETVIGFYAPKKGSIFLEGRDITALPPDKRQISIVYQDHMLFPHMDVFENIAYALRKKLRDKKQIESEVRQIAGILGIDGLLHRKPTTLSGGEKQRAALARSLVVRPKLLLLDEPFSALDMRNRENMREVLKKAIREYRTTVLQVTHDFDDIWSLANRVIIIRQGEVMQEGDPESVFRQPSPDFVADFLGTNVLKGKVRALEGKLTVLEILDRKRDSNPEKDESKDRNLNQSREQAQNQSFEIYSADPAEPGEEVSISIRPEEIILAKGAVESSARNTVKGIVTGISKKEHLVLVEMEIGNSGSGNSSSGNSGQWNSETGISELKAVVTPTSCELLDLEIGKEIYAVFKAANARIIR